MAHWIRRTGLAAALSIGMLGALGTSASAKDLAYKVLHRLGSVSVARTG